jgi:zinc protease
MKSGSRVLLSIVGALSLALAPHGQAWALEIATFTSPSGLSGWISPDPAAKDVAIIVSWTDGIGDPAKVKRGLRELALPAMAAGAGDLDEVDLKSAIQDLGSSIFLRPSDGPRIAMVIRAKPDKLDETIKLAHAVLTQPRFAAVDIQRLRKVFDAARAEAVAKPQGKLAYAIAKIIRPTDPMTMVELKPSEPMPDIARDDLIAWHHDRFARDNILISVAGAIVPEAAGRVIDDLVAGLPAKSNVPQLPNIVLAGGGQVVHVPADSEQTLLTMMGPFLPDGGADEAVEGAAGDILAEYIGNPSAGRLNKKIREERGLSYGISAGVAGGVRVSVFVANTSVPPDLAAEVLGLTRSVLAEVANQGIPETDLMATKERMIARFGKNLTSPSAIAGTLSGFQNRQRPLDHFAKYPTYIQAVTKPQVDALAQKYLVPDKMTVFLTGPVVGIKPTLTYDGK